MCDDHPDRPAVARIQGETDSFGCEMIDMCQECFDAYREEIKNEDTSGVCDWCKQLVHHRRPHRDFEEGMTGRVYDVCDACIAKELEAELDYYLDYYDDGW